MKACKEFLKEKGLIVEKVFRIPSRSEEGKFHIVELLGNGELKCDCVAGSFNRFCRHKRKVAEILTKKGIHFKAEGQMKIPDSY